MKKEDLLKLGLDEETAKKVAEASEEELKGYVPKSKFDELDAGRKQLDTSLKERDIQLETLKKSTGNVDELKNQIETLQNENKTTKEKHATDMKELKLSSAIKLVLSGKVHDEDLAAGLFDKTKLVLSDDGKVVGLEEQLKALQENKAFLFKQTDNANNKQKQYYTPKAGEVNEQSLAKTIAAGLNKEAGSNPYANAWAQK